MKSSCDCEHHTHDPSGTGRPTEHRVRRGRYRVLTAGFNQHLAKPIDPIDLARAVAQLAERA